MFHVKHFLTELRGNLDTLASRSLRRRLRPLAGTGRIVTVDGQPLLNLASNDYLGLATHPRLKAAAADAVHRFGTGAGASRLVAGHLDLHEQTQRAFTRLKHGEVAADDAASLLFPTGYMANLAVVTTLAGPDDLICLDKLCHASLIDAARASGAEVRVFPHLNHDKLARLLGKAGDGNGERQRRTLIVTDSVFSMDGDVADLPRLCDLADRHDAVLVVDEAHATGVLGETGAGLCQQQGVTDRVDVVISTASKALGGLGGIVTASAIIIDTLVNAARSFIYTTAIPPGQVAAIAAAVEVVRDEPWRRERVLALASQVRQALEAGGWSLPATEVATPIIPLVVGTADDALALQRHLEKQGLLGVAIRPPTVAPGSARVRLSLRADLSDEDVRRLLEVVGSRDRAMAAAGSG